MEMSYVTPTARILSLDAAAGEAQAGFAQIKIIRALMKEIWKRKNNDKDTPTDVDIDAMRPSDYFDIIFGSGTGGIIAVYLGRLHLTMEECERRYKELGEKVYAHPRTIWSPFQYIYDCKRLETVLKEQTTENGITQDFPDKDMGCKAVVLTKMSNNTESAHLVASYDIRSGKTWEAIRAVTASRHHFPCVKVGLDVLFAAEVGFSNPAGVAWNEARKQYPPPKRNRTECLPTRGICLISIGSGTRPSIGLHIKGAEAPRYAAKWWLYWARKLFLLTVAICIAVIGRATRLPQVQELTAVASECESTHDDLGRRFNAKDPSALEDLGRCFVPERSGYFRFNFDPDRVLISEPEAVEATEKVSPSTFGMVAAGIRRGSRYLWGLTNESERWNRIRFRMEQIANQEYLGQDVDVNTMNRLGSAAALLIEGVPGSI